MAPAIKIVPSLLQQVKFHKNEVMEGEEVSMTVQTSRDKDRYRGRFEIGRLEEYGGQDIYIRHAGPFYKYPEEAGGYEVTWTVTTPMIDRSEITAQWQIDEAKAQAEETGETYSGPDAYRGIELIARAKHLGLQSDSTGASRTGPDWTGTLTVKDDVSVQLTDLATGAAISGVDVTILLPDGTEETQTLGDDGTVTLENVSPGPIAYFFPDLPGSSRESPVVGVTGQENSTSLWRIRPQQEHLEIDESNPGVPIMRTGDVTPGTWIYLFPERVDGIQFPIEAYVQDDGSLKLVDGNNTSIWEDDERPADQDAPTTETGTAYLPLLGTRDLRHVHVMLSAVQLTSRRIEAYRTGNDSYGIADGPLIRERCFTISEDEIERARAEGTVMLGYAYADVENELLDVSVPHPMQWAEAAHRSYRKAVQQRDLYNAETGVVRAHASITKAAIEGIEKQAENSTKETIARGIEGIFDDDVTAWDFVNKEKLNGALDSMNASMDTYCERIEDAGSLLYGGIVLNTDRYRHARFDETDALIGEQAVDEVDEETRDEVIDLWHRESTYLEDIEQCHAGRDYLAVALGGYVAHDPEFELSEQGNANWYDQIAFALASTVNTGRTAASLIAENLYEAPRSELMGKRAQLLDEADDAARKAFQAYQRYISASVQLWRLTEEVDRLRSSCFLMSAPQRAHRLAGHLISAVDISRTIARPLVDGLDSVLPKSGLMRGFTNSMLQLGSWAGQSLENTGSNVQDTSERILQGQQDQKVLMNEARTHKQEQRAEQHVESQKRQRAYQTLQEADDIYAGQRVAGRIAVGLSGLNVVILMQTFTQTDWTDVPAETYVLATSSLLDGIGSMRHLAAETMEVNAQGQLVGRALFLKRLTQGAAVVEGVFYFYKGVKNLNDADPGASAGYFIALAGAAATLFPLWWVGLIGLAVSVAGTYIASMFGDTEVEKWLKRCAWADPEYSDLDRPEAERAFVEGDLDAPPEEMLLRDLEGFFRITGAPQVVLTVREDGERVSATQRTDSMTRFHPPSGPRPDEILLEVYPKLTTPTAFQYRVQSVSLYTDGIRSDETVWQPSSENVDSDVESRSDGTLRVARWSWPLNRQPDVEAIRSAISSSLKAAVTVELQMRIGDSVTAYVFKYDGDAGLRFRRETAMAVSGTFDHDASGRLLLEDPED